MVNRLSKDDAVTDLLVVDLDGTYSRFNTFSRFVSYLISDRLSHCDYRCVMRIVWQVVLRKLRCISHAEAKEGIMRSSLNVFGEMDEFYSHFVRKLAPAVNEQVDGLVREYQARGAKVVLATAAPAQYAVPFAREHGFDYCIASDSSDLGSQFYECKGENKLNRIEELARRRGLRIAGIITDHEDDMPLLKVAPVRYLVSPSSATVKTIRNSGIDFIRID